MELTVSKCTRDFITRIARVGVLADVNGRVKVGWWHKFTRSRSGTVVAPRRSSHAEPFSARRKE